MSQLFNRGRFLKGSYFPSEKELLAWLRDEHTKLLADYGWFALIYASRHGYLEVVKLLLADKRVDPSSQMNRAIREASSNGHSEVVKLLLTDPRVDPAFKNNEAVRRAFENGHSEVVQVLLADHRVYPLELEELVCARETIVTYLFQRYCQLLLIGVESDVVQTIIGLVVT